MKEIKLLKRRNSIGGDVFKIVFLGYINLKRKSSICNYKKRLKMVIVNFDYGKKKFKIRADECRGFISKARGLIFQKNPKALMFIFTSKTQQSIHSFFCKPSYLFNFRWPGVSHHSLSLVIGVYTSPHLAL